jgi:large subunit ribosomal protein L24
MKTSFSTHWLFSTQPRKQRKYRYNAPLHTRGKFLTAKLSKELAKKHGVRSLRVRSEDKVLIMRGQFKGTSGSVDVVDLARERIYVNGADLTKKEGGKVPYPIHPSNVMITAIKEDKKRFKKSSTESKPEAKK